MNETLTPEIAQQIADQTRLTELGLHDLERRWGVYAVQTIVTFGEGYPEEQTLTGNPSMAFHGVAVYNTSGNTIAVGFGAKGSIGSPLRVPPGSLLVWPAVFADLSLSALNPLGMSEQIAVLRLPYPPSTPGVYPLAPLAASTTNSLPQDIIVKEVSVQLLPANPLRRGVEVINIEAAAVRLVLGQGAAVKHGLWLSGSGGTWNGLLSNALWLGSIFARCPVGETTVALVEA